MIQHRILASVVTILPFLSLHSARADEFAGKDLSLRFSAALSRFEPYADVAAKGGSSAALPFGSSNNPAAGAWHYPDGFDNQGKPTDYRIMLSGQYTNVAFENGTQLHFASDSITLGTPESGVFRLDTGAIESNTRTVRNVPLGFGFELGGGRLNYAKKFGDFSIGATAGYAHSTTTFSTGGINLVDAEKDIWNFRLGGLWNPEESNWFLGIVSTYIYGPTDTAALVRLPSGGSLLVNSSDATQQFTVQPGVAYHWRRAEHIQGYIHADYQFVNLSNRTGSLTEHRFLAGVDIPIKKAIYARAGAFTDARGNTGWSTGVGIYLDHRVLIDLAYQNNNFPEVAAEFGHSRTLNASVTVRW